MPEYARHGTTQKESPTLEQALDLLLEQTARRVRDELRSPATLEMQHTHAAWMLAQGLGSWRLDQITTPKVVEILERWRTTGGAGGNPLNLKTVAKRKSTLRRALQVAAEAGLLARVPDMPEIGLPPLRPRVRILQSYSELLMLKTALPLRRWEWVSVAVWTIQRPGDTERMCWSDVRLPGARSHTPHARDAQASMRIRSTKTRRRVGIWVKMPTPLVQVLTSRRRRLTEEGSPPRPTDPLVEPWPAGSKVLPVVCARLGLPPMTRMDLRHTGISWAVRKTGLTPGVQTWGGWSDFSMMSRYYAHALPAGLSEVADELGSMAAANDNATAAHNDNERG